MADLTYAEKAVIEKLVVSRNGSGYVLDFSDISFRQFIHEVTKIDVDASDKYRQHGNSKAKRLKSFLQLEDNSTVSKLVMNLVEYRKSWTEPLHPSVYSDCMRIVERLRGNLVAEEIYDIQAITDEKDFDLLAKSIVESIEKDQPEAALDRLHTYVMKFVRALCTKRQISFTQSENLNAIFSKYVKHLKNNDLLESVMAEKILIYSFEVMSAFNAVRNDKSFAHDNPLLNYDESVLITRNIANSIKFIRKIEEKLDLQSNYEVPLDDMPF